MLAQSSKNRSHHINLNCPRVKLIRNHQEPCKHIVAVGSRFFTADSAGRMYIYDHAILTKTTQQNHNSTQNSHNTVHREGLTNGGTDPGSTHKSPTRAQLEPN